MNQITKQCQNCKQEFVIEPEDFLFYEKIKVPAPTWCSECRFQRRMIFRSGRRVYKRVVQFSEKDVFSQFPPESPYKIVDEKYFWSDKWDSMDYGRDYDFSRPFFEQMRELLLAVPMPHRRVLNSVNSDYCFNAVNIKDCYLCFNAGFTENSFYGETINGCRDCVDTLKVENCELSYELFNCQKCFRARFSSHCVDCTDILFCTNVVGCSNCFGCVNLRNKQYYVFNRPYSKEEYFKITQGYDLGSDKTIQSLRDKFAQIILRFPVKFRHGQRNVDVSGDYLDRCKDTYNSFYSCDLERCSYCQLILFASSSDCMDISVAGGELCYELQEAGGYETKFCLSCVPGNILRLSSFLSLQYSMNCFGASSSYLFGCVGLRNKSYCILNKQYSKEEYEKLVLRIIQHMGDMPYTDKKGRIYKYGEFFPPEFSPFPYNETWAQDYFPLSKEKVADLGYYWKDPEPRNYQIQIPNDKLPDHIKDVKDDIVGQVIECAHYVSQINADQNADKRGLNISVDLRSNPRESACGEQCTEAFKIIPQELQFYRKMNLPLPRLCPNCRHYQRIKQRNPLKLWHRRCCCNGKESGITNKELGYKYQNTAIHFHGENPCPNEFETSYAPERPEIVYCEACYNNEVV